MPISAIKSNTAVSQAEDVSIEKIAESKTLSEEQKVSQMARQFEAVLLRQILTQAQKPAFKSTLTPNAGVSGDIYQDMMVNEMAEKISSSRTIGLAQQLEKQVTRQVHGQALNNKSQTPVESPKPNVAAVHATKTPRL